PRGQYIHAFTVRGDATLRRPRLVQSKRPQKLEIPVCTRPTSDRARFEFENRFKTHVHILHLESRPSSDPRRASISASLLAQRMAARTASSSASLRKGLSRNATAPACRDRRRVSSSP